jgi:hypothetical protein
MSAIKRTACVLLLGGALSACTTDGFTSYSVGVGYGTGGYYDPYYDPYYGGLYYDPFYGSYVGSFYGQVLYGGHWYHGPLRWRHGRHGREYWLRDGWHRPEQEQPGQPGEQVEDRSTLHPRLQDLGRNDGRGNRPATPRVAGGGERPALVRERTAAPERAAPPRERAQAPRERAQAAPRPPRNALYPRLSRQVTGDE